MCGRYTLASSPTSLTETFPEFEFPDELTPRYNITPSQPIAVVPNNGSGQVEFYRWGLIPSWAKDPKIGNRMINARSETLAEKPSFRNAYKRRRCLVLADGYYEWRKDNGGPKTPFYIRMESEKPFGFAGLWETWKPSGETEPVLSCSIITCAANEFTEPIHHRMPVILDQDAYDLWLEPDECPPTTLNHLLTPYAHEDMVAFPVSRLVNQPKNDSPECIVPV